MIYNCHCLVLSHIMAYIRTNCLLDDFVWQIAVSLFLCFPVVAATDYFFFS